MTTSLQEKKLREHLRSILGNSIYSDDVIEVIVNCQLNKWTDADIQAYHNARKAEFEKMKQEFDTVIPIEEQIIHSPAVFYHDNVKDGSDSANTNETS